MYWVFNKVFEIYRYQRFFIFFLGFTIALHLSLTVFAVKQGQSDLSRYGAIFSVVFIFMLNCLVIGLILVLFFPVGIGEYVNVLAGNLKDAATGSGMAVQYLCDLVGKK